MIKNKNAFINESYVGSHHKVDVKFNADVFSFTFAPNIYNFKEDDLNFGNLLPSNLSPIYLNGILVKLDSFWLTIKEYEYIFIGADFNKWNFLSFSETLLIMANELETSLYKYQRALKKQKD